MVRHNADQVGADRRRQQIPFHLQAIFEDTTNAGLGSMTEDFKLPPETRIYARNELEYREAFGIFVDFPPDAGNIRRRTFSSDADVEAAFSADKAAATARPKRPDTALSRLLDGPRPRDDHPSTEASPALRNAVRFEEAACATCGATFTTTPRNAAGTPSCINCRWWAQAEEERPR